MHLNAMTAQAPPTVSCIPLVEHHIGLGTVQQSVILLPDCNNSLSMKMNYLK